MIALLQDLKPYLLLLVLPPVPFLALALVGAGLLRRHRTGGRSLLAVAVLGFWLSCTEGAGQWLALHLVGTPPALDPATVQTLREEQAQRGGVAVLILGAGVRRHVPEYDDNGPQRLTLERLRYGIWLSRRLAAPAGFTGGIGWAASKHLKTPEAEVVARVAREEFGLPLRWAESQSRDTRENAALTLPLLKADGVRKVVLVTHDLHMPRALRAFSGQGLEIVPAPVGLRDDAMSEVGDWFPDAEGFGRVRYAIYEWLGYRLGR